MNPTVVLASFALGLLLPACGGSVSPTDASTPPMDAATPDAHPDAAATAGFTWGEVLISGVASPSTPSPDYTLSAGFAYTPPGATNPCRFRTEGSCHIVACDQGPHFPADYVSAGTLTIAGTSSGPYVDEWRAGDGYGGIRDRTPSVAVHDQLTISAAGDTVPAFSVQLEFPTSIHVNSPQIYTNPTIDRTTPFVTEWVGDFGHVEVRFEQNWVDGPTYRLIRCIVPTSDHTATVPPSVLAELLPSQLNDPNGHVTSLTISTVNTQDVAATDSAAIWVSVTNFSFNAGVTVQ